MKRKVLFLVVAIMGLVVTANLDAFSGRGYCMSTGWRCIAVCPDCGTWYRPASGGRSGTGILTFCGNCQFTKSAPGEDEVEMELD